MFGPASPEKPRGGANVQYWIKPDEFWVVIPYESVSSLDNEGDFTDYIFCYFFYNNILFLQKEYLQNGNSLWYAWWVY